MADLTTTNLARPKTNATLTVRLIKSFEYRTTKNAILKNLNLEELTVRDLVDMCKKGIL